MKVATLQYHLNGPREANFSKVERGIRDAAADGAQVIVPPELFELPYFCTTQQTYWFDEARPLTESAAPRLAELAKELAVVLLYPFFEREGNAYFNSAAVIDASGSVLGVYRKSHIPDGPGYQEKFYFQPGNSGFRVWPTRYGKLGVAICWDQWFPECARSLVLQGAEILLYPSAIGSEPHDPRIDTRHAWRRVMQGHAAANRVPVVASNRIGPEDSQVFYGHSSIADESGDIVGELPHGEGWAIGEVIPRDLKRERAGWGFFRDRRPDLYVDLVKP